MIAIKQYIYEKLRISKTTKTYDVVDKNNKKMLLDILKAEFISLYEQHFDKHNIFKQTGLSSFTIKRLKVDYENIVKVLNEYYGYSFNINEVTDKKSDLYRLLHYFLDYMDKLINFRQVKIPFFDEIIKGGDIYWTDWKNYGKTLNIQT